MFNLSLKNFQKLYAQSCITIPVPLSFICSWSLCAGIACATIVPKVLICCYLFGAALVLVRRRFFILVPFLFFGLGAYRYTRYTQSFQESAHFFQQHPRLAGKAVVKGLQYIHGSRYPWCLSITIIELKKKTVPSCTSVKINVPHAIPLLPGDEIDFKRLTFKKHPKTVYQHYLFKEGIVASTYITHFTYTRIQRPRFHLRRWCTQKRDAIISHLMHTFSQKTASLFTTIFMGGKSANTFQELHNYFAYWGITHFLARSGLHVMVLLSVWRNLLLFCRFPWLLNQAILICMLLVYYVLSWPSISFIRACLSWILYQGFRGVKKSPRVLHILSLTTLCVLIHNPYQLHYLDFQLSFFLSCALAWWQEAHYQLNYQKTAT